MIDIILFHVEHNMQNTHLVLFLYLIIPFSMIRIMGLLATPARTRASARVLAHVRARRMSMS
jgi:hypothetical protein